MTEITGDEMDHTYSVAKKILDGEMKVDLALREKFQELARRKPLVIPGQHDNIGRLLEVMKIPFDTCSLSKIIDYQLQEKQPVFVNCGTSHMDRGVISRLREHVESGSIMVSTDWAVSEVLEKTFPGFIERSGQTGSNNESFPVDGGASWFVEHASYPIRIMSDEVKVLMTSKEFGDKYNCNPALSVGFRFGSGGVVHYVSHLYAQMIELRNERERGTATDFATAKGVDLGGLGETVTVGATESAYATMSSVLESSVVLDDIFGQTERPSVQNPMGGNVRLSCNEPVLCYNGVTSYGVELLPFSELTIGRSISCDLTIANRKVSRQHARFLYSDDGLYVEDLESHNGTFVNDRRVQREQIYQADRVSFGGKIQVRVDQI